MKLQVLTKNIKNIDLTIQGLNSVKAKLATMGVPFEYAISETSKNFYGVSNIYIDSTGQKITSVIVNPLDAFHAFAGFNADLFFLNYNADDVFPRPTNPSTLGKTIQMPEYWYGIYPEVFAQFFLHELCHSKSQEFGKPDLTHNQYQNPAYSQKPPIEYYLFLLKGLIVNNEDLIVNQLSTKPMEFSTVNSSKDVYNVPMYKYFSAKEIVGLKPELVELLDKARGIAGIPFVIESGLRSKDKNVAVGGVQNSAHLKGEAVDLKCTDGSKRMKMVKALLEVGFKRIGIGNNFIHADISKTLPQDVIWEYYG